MCSTQTKRNHSVSDKPKMVNGSFHLINCICGTQKSAHTAAKNLHRTVNLLFREEQHAHPAWIRKPARGYCAALRLNCDHVIFGKCVGRSAAKLASQTLYGSNFLPTTTATHPWGSMAAEVVPNTSTAMVRSWVPAT